MGHYASEMCCQTCMKQKCVCPPSKEMIELGKRMDREKEAFKQEMYKAVSRMNIIPNTSEFKQPICGKCNIKLESVMSYSCQNNDCPCGLGPIGTM